MDDKQSLELAQEGDRAMIAESRATLDELARLAEVAGPGLGETRDQCIRGVLARIYLRVASELYESADDLERNADEVAKLHEEDEARRRKLAAMLLREHACVMMLRTRQLAEDKAMQAVESLVRPRQNPMFFHFIRECATHLGIQGIDEQANLISDPCWFYCFDDGMSPAEAVAKYRNSQEAKTDG